MSFVTDVHPAIGEEQMGNDTCCPASVSVLYFLYRYEPSTSTILAPSCWVCFTLDQGKVSVQLTIIKRFREVIYLLISSCFFQEVRALIPLQSNHQHKAEIVCPSYGSERFAPGISSGERVTSLLITFKRYLQR